MFYYLARLLRAAAILLAAFQWVDFWCSCRGFAQIVLQFSGLCRAAGSEIAGVI
jgi:hypothetical protein